MGTTTDPADPRLGHGPDAEPGPQNETYLVLSRKERRKGFVRPLRLSYRHVGIPGPQYPLRDLTGDEQERYAGTGYVKFEPYPDAGTVTGKFWTRGQLDCIDGGCRHVTRMSQDIAETYARSPAFYGSTYCVGCQMHLPVGAAGEFTWMNPDGTDSMERVGT